jgi:hypothetical protein
MSRRPVSITIIGCVFIAVGGIGLIAHAWPMLHPGAPQALGGEAEPLGDLVLAAISSLAAMTGGAFVLNGRSWARWLLMAWLAFHVVLSAMHALVELVVHSLLAGVVLYVLFRPRAAAFFAKKGVTRLVSGSQG